MSKMNGAMNAAIELITQFTQSAPRTLSFEEMAEIIHREAVADLLEALEEMKKWGCCLMAKQRTCVENKEPRATWCASCIARAAIARYEEGEL